MHFKLPHVLVVAIALATLGWNIGQASAERSAVTQTASTAQLQVAPSENEASPSNVALPEADALQGGSCGDYQCSPPEDCHSCPQDCGDCCGNGRCEPPEDGNSCPSDCG